MAIKTEKGAEIHYFESDKFKKTLISVNFYRPIENEAAKNALLSLVMKASCRKYPEKSAMEKHLEWMYGAVFKAFVRKKGETQVLSFEISVPSDAFTGEDTVNSAAEFLKEIIYAPNFDEKIISLEKENLKNIIAASQNDKREYATQRCMEEMFPHDPFSEFVYGSINSVDKISADDLKKHYEKVINESEAQIFVSGSCDIDAFKEIFSCVKSGGAVSGCTPAVPRGTVKEVHELMDINQGKLVIGMTVSAPYADTVVMNSVFGSGTHSKLFNNVREKLSLAYYAYSRYNRFKDILVIGTGIEFDKFKSARDEIMNQLSEVQNGNISNFELEAAKKFIENMYASMADDPNMLIDFYITQRVAGESGGIEEFLEKVNAVSMQDVVKAAKTVKTDTVYFLKGLN